MKLAGLWTSMIRAEDESGDLGTRLILKVKV